MCHRGGKAELENATLQKPLSGYVISQNAFEMLDFNTKKLILRLENRWIVSLVTIHYYFPVFKLLDFQTISYNSEASIKYKK